MDERIERFRGQVETHFGGRPGRGARYPEELRAEAVAIARRELARDESLGSVAGRLGIGSATLGRWLEAPPTERRELRPVEVIEVEEPEGVANDPAPVEGHLVLLTAGGHRVEGLLLDELALLLEALG